jgi:hypothetical protein
MALVFVGVGLMSLVAVSILAVDVGLLMTSRNQAQNSADAGALAGAISLAFDDYDDRSSSGPAVQNSLQAARGNNVAGDMVSVTPADVTFPQMDWVKVDVFMSAGRGNPIATLVAQYFGRPTMDVTASATAEAAPTNAANCILPFAVPDKWVEMNTPAWDVSDEFEAFPKNGATPDVYVPVGSPSYSGYSPWTDRGLLLPIKQSNGNKINPSIYYPVALPGSMGSDDYRWNIANCNTSVLHIGEPLVVEPGNQVGPTVQGVEELIALDPSAYWDGTRVVTSMHPSPRTRLMPVFDPYFYNTGKENGRNADFKIANFIGIFVEGMQGNDVIGRLVPAAGLLDSSNGPVPAGAYPRAVRLVE